MYFQYGEKETNYLKSKCKKLAEVIEKVGHINREIEQNLFISIIHQIVGQQISMKAHETIWRRFKDNLATITPKTILNTGVEELQTLGISYKKAEYIIDFAQKVKNKDIDLDSLYRKSDEEVIQELSSLKGIGVWTAEMLLLFCLERQNVLSFNDLGIQRGLRMIYHHRKITKQLYEKYRKRFSPYCSVASFYLWAVSGGAIEDMKDYAPLKTSPKSHNKKTANKITKKKTN